MEIYNKNKIDNYLLTLNDKICNALLKKRNFNMYSIDLCRCRTIDKKNHVLKELVIKFVYF